MEWLASRDWDGDHRCDTHETANKPVGRECRPARDCRQEHVIATKSGLWRADGGEAQRISGCSDVSARSEKPITRVAKARQDVPDRIELSIQRCGDDRDIRVRRAKSFNTSRSSNQTDEPNARRTGLLEARDRLHRTTASRKHGIKKNELAFLGIRGNLEIVVNGLKRLVITVQAYVPNARGRNEAKDSVHHAQAGPQNGHEHKLLSRNSHSVSSLERGFDGAWLEGEVGRGFVRHERRNLVNELLENLRRRVAIAENGELVLHEWMTYDAQAGDCRGGGHAVESSIFAAMKEYQAVIVRLSRRVREDEDAITDLLNERSRSGWQPELMTQDPDRVTVVFSRRAAPSR